MNIVIYATGTVLGDGILATFKNLENIKSHEKPTMFHNGPSSSYVTAAMLEYQEKRILNILWEGTPTIVYSKNPANL